MIWDISSNLGTVTKIKTDLPGDISGDINPIYLLYNSRNYLWWHQMISSVLIFVHIWRDSLCLLLRKQTECQQIFQTLKDILIPIPHFLLLPVFHLTHTVKVLVLWYSAYMLNILYTLRDYLGKLYIVSSFVFPQVGGLSALQRSRVGSLLPISTPTVVHEMTWNWAPQKLEKVSHCRLSRSCPPTHTSTHTTSHTLLYTHTQMPPLPSVLSLWSVTKWSKRTPVSPLPAYANGWRRAGVNNSLCLPAIISTLEQSTDSGPSKQKEQCQERPDHKRVWRCIEVTCCTVLHCRDAMQY